MTIEPLAYTLRKDLESLNPELDRKLLELPDHLLDSVEKLTGFDHEVNLLDILAKPSVSFNGWNLSSHDVVSLFDANPRSKRKQELQALSGAEQFHR